MPLGIADARDIRVWNTSYGFEQETVGSFFDFRYKLLRAYAKNNTLHFGSLDDCFQTSSLSKIRSFDFSMYPNPAHQTVQVQLLTQAKVAQTTLFNLQGQLIWQAKPNPQNGTFELDFGKKLESGVYFLKIQTEDGAVGVQRIVLR